MSFFSQLLTRKQFLFTTLRFVLKSSEENLDLDSLNSIETKATAKKGFPKSARENKKYPARQFL